MTMRPLWLVERAMERVHPHRSVSLPSQSSIAPAPAQPRLPIPSDHAVAITGPSMRGAPDSRAVRSGPLPPRLQSAIMWMFGLGWLALVIVSGAYYFTLSEERASVSTAPPPAVAPQAAAPQAIAPPAPAVVATAAAPQTDDDLVPSGIGLMRTGDIATARLYFERAAEAGNAHAALLVGETYDGPLLSKLGVRGMRGDPQEATRWYERARDLGDADAAERLVGIADVK